jgi:hypothetical protein
MQVSTELEEQVVAVTEEAHQQQELLTRARAVAARILVTLTEEQVAQAS